MSGRVVSLTNPHFILKMSNYRTLSIVSIGTDMGNEQIGIPGMLINIQKYA
jgi:phage tail tube protein FII